MYFLNYKILDFKFDKYIVRSLNGRRIVDIRHLFTQIMNSRHEKFDCSFLDMDFISEIRKGYSSKFKFVCKMCGITSFISTENENENNYMPINQSIINGSLAIGLLVEIKIKQVYFSTNIQIFLGIGHTQLSELFASVEIPSLSSTAYLNNLSTISDIVQDTAIEEMIKAGNEERRLAIESGNIDKDGIPVCTVIADGQWSKRSYKTKFNAFSGAVIYIYIYL